MKKIFVISTVIFTIALVRLTDAVIKKVIANEAERLNKTNEVYFLKNESLNTHIQKIDQEIKLLQLKKGLTDEAECYLVLERKTRQAWLKIEDKVIQEMSFSVWLLPELSEKSYLPSGILQILAKQESTHFVLPDFYYELLGESIPTDTTKRIIKNGLGEYALYLGENLLIHGPFHPDLPKDLVRHNAIIFKPEDLKVIYYSLKPKARVVFY
uniref:Uncharacterized protein n=1 Tax=candidate division WOR-3 bacterium TaxID=2052148 RepID=A0A7C6EA52_UNCW3